MNSDQRAKQERLQGISVLEIIFVVAFMLFVGIIIYFLMNTLSAKEIIPDVQGGNSSDQVEFIMKVTDNAINMIYNVLVVSTIFFTVLIASVSIFQFIKIRDVDNLKRELSYELTNMEKELNIKIQSSEEKIFKLEQKYINKISEIEKYYKERSDSLNYLGDQFKEKILQLNHKALELEIDMLYIRAKEIERREIFKFSEILTYYQRILGLLEENPSIKPSKFMYEINIKIASIYLPIAFQNDDLYRKIKSYLDEALRIGSESDFEEYELVTAYKLYVQLEQIIFEDGGNDIFYLEKIFDENKYDFEAGMELAKALDKRNEEHDMDKEMEVLRTIVRVNSYDPQMIREQLSEYKNLECFNNLLKSKFSNEFNILIDTAKK